MRVIADPTLQPRHSAAFDIGVRVLLSVGVAALIFWMLPVIAGAAA